MRSTKRIDRGFARSILNCYVGAALAVLSTAAAHGQSYCPIGINCVLPIMTPWVYGESYSSASAIQENLALSFRKASFGCPLTTEIAPFARYVRMRSSAVRIGNGTSITEVSTWEQAYYTTMKTQEVYSARKTWCPSELVGFMDMYQHSFYPIDRRRSVVCPPNLGFVTPTNGERVIVCGEVRPLPAIVLDPGHGTDCPLVAQKSGAVGVTDFTTPPVGKLKEDDLTVAIALETEKALSSRYRVILTKRTVKACPTFLERGRFAKNVNARAFVSIHINAPNQVLGIDVPIGNGTSALINTDLSYPLANSMASHVSYYLDVNNRGVRIDRSLAVIKPTVSTKVAVLLEAARLSGDDEQKLHAPEGVGRVSKGIAAAVNQKVSTF